MEGFVDLLLDVLVRPCEHQLMCRQRGVVLSVLIMASFMVLPSLSKTPISTTQKSTRANYARVEQ